MGELTLINFRNYYKSTGIKTVCHWNKNRHRNQWNIIDSSEVNPYIYGQLIFDKVPKPFARGKSSVFTDGAETNGRPRAEERTWSPPHTVYKS